MIVVCFGGCAGCSCCGRRRRRLRRRVRKHALAIWRAGRPLGQRAATGTLRGCNQSREEAQLSGRRSRRWEQLILSSTCAAAAADQLAQLRRHSCATAWPQLAHVVGGGGRSSCLRRVGGAARRRGRPSGRSNGAGLNYQCRRREELSAACKTSCTKYGRHMDSASSLHSNQTAGFGGAAAAAAALVVSQAACFGRRCRRRRHN